MSIPLILYLIFYFILAKIRLDWAVMLLIAALPTYLIRFNFLGVPFTLLEAMILTSFTVWVIANLRQIVDNIKSRIKVFQSANWRTKFKIISIRQSASRRSGQNSKLIKYPFDVEIILMLIISFVAVAVAGFSNSALGIWKAYFFEPVLVFILVLNFPFLSFRTDPPAGPAAREQRGWRIGMTKRAIRDDNSQAVWNKKTHCNASLRKILWPLTISAFFVSIFAIYQKFTGAFIFNELWTAEETRRVTSFFGYPNAVGLFLGPIVMAMIGWLVNKTFNFQSASPLRQLADRRSGQFLKILFIAATIILSLLSIYFAKSEGALIGVAAGLIIFGILAGKKTRWATLLLIFVMGAGIMVYQPTRNYAIKKITLRDLSGEIRKQQWKETWQMLQEGRIITGAGLADYQNAIKPYHQEGIFFNKDNDPDFRRKIVIFDDKYRIEHWQPVEVYLYPHNILLNFWVEFGLAGMLLFIWIIGKYFVVGITNYKLQITNNKLKNKYISLGLVCAMAVIVVHGLVDVPYLKNDLAVMFWLFVAMMSLVNLKNFHKSTNQLTNL